MNSNRVLTPFLVTGDPDSVNVPAPSTTAQFAREGELGAQFDCNRNGRGWKYQLVKLDSGCTASTGIGVVAANQLAYWKDHSNYLVTNDYTQAEPELVTQATGTNAFANFVAGVFRVAATAGNYCCVLQRGYNVKIKSAAGLSATGMTVVANVSTPVADVTGVAVGTASTYRPLGICRVPVSAAVAYVDLEIPDFD
jgi:hypothetical protein